MKALDDSASTDLCTLYEDSVNFLKDERFTKIEYQTSANLYNVVEYFESYSRTLMNLIFQKIVLSQFLLKRILKTLT